MPEATGGPARGDGAADARNRQDGRYSQLARCGRQNARTSLMDAVNQNLHLPTQEDGQLTSCVAIWTMDWGGAIERPAAAEPHLQEARKLSLMVPSNRTRSLSRSLNVWLALNLQDVRQAGATNILRACSLHVQVRRNQATRGSTPHHSADLVTPASDILDPGAPELPDLACQLIWVASGLFEDCWCISCYRLDPHSAG